jgi:hypothetical protein
MGVIYSHLNPNQPPVGVPLLRFIAVFISLSSPGGRINHKIVNAAIIKAEYDPATFLTHFRELIEANWLLLSLTFLPEKG